MSEVEKVARDFRAGVRKKAGLNLDWDKASDDMKEWYRMLARRALEGS